jgi:acid phosphatase type 7
VNSTDPHDPYHNAAGVTHVVTGAAGGREGHDKMHAPRGPWSAVRDLRYGYGRLRLENRSHVHWEELESGNGTVIDEFWLSKDEV